MALRVAGALLHQRQRCSRTHLDEQVREGKGVQQVQGDEARLHEQRLQVGRSEQISWGADVQIEVRSEGDCNLACTSKLGCEMAASLPVPTPAS